MSLSRPWYSSSLFPRLSFTDPISTLFDDDPFFGNPFGTYSVWDEPRTTTTGRSNKQQRITGSSPNSQTGQMTTTGDNTAVAGRSGDLQQVANRHHHHFLPVSFFSPLTTMSNRMPDMTVDMFSTPTTYSIHAAVPGIDKKDISVSIEEGNVLRIAAERREERKERIAPPSGKAQIQEESKQQQPEERKTGAGAAQNTAGSTTGSTAGSTAGTTASPRTGASSMQVDSDKTNKTGMEEDDLRYHHIESFYGHVERRVQLPDDSNVEGLEARYENGVLKINIPRVQEKKQQARKIEVA